MATTQRESLLGLGMDKKPTRSLPRISTTPSMIPRLGKISPKETTSSSCTNNKARTVRNHVKPSSTSPSSPPSKLVKKQHDSSANRRRSFDKPHPIVTRKQPSKAHPKSNASVRTVRRSVTAPTSPRKALASSSKKVGKKSSINSKPTLMPCVEADFGDGYAFPDDIEEIANIGSDEDLVPFDQMELPNINPYTSVDVLMPDPVVLVITPNEETQDHKVQEQVETSNQHMEDRRVGKVDHKINNSEEKTREFEGGNEMEEEKLQGEEAERPETVSVKAEARKQQRQGDKDKDKGKKDSPVYNDVIEETASRLLEKRKNKVRALVGAFETVISLQD